MVASKSIETEDGVPESQVVERKKSGPKPKKTGTRSWAPAAPLGIRSSNPDYRVKWVYTDPANMMRKRAEGWVPADVGDAIHDRPHGVETGKGAPSGVLEYRDMILMKIPEEMARERADYYDKQAKRQLNGVNARAKKEIRQGTGVEVTGDITIE